MMKNAILISIVFCNFSTLAFGEVTVKTYMADGITPFDCNNDIMVGGRLCLVVSSDSNDYWSGGLFISGEERTLGILLGRDYNPNTRDYTGSHFQAAGELARVSDWDDSLISGFDLYTFYLVDTNSFDDSTIAGDWFVIDYRAEQIGDCDIGFYDYEVSWDIPIEVITLSNVATRDFDSDGKVDFNDFALFSNQWMKTNCTELNYCSGADLDFDGDVDCNDLGLFVRFWLWGTCEEESGSPGDGQIIPADPNVIYRIVDANGNSEITIDVNESVTLYVDMETNDVNVFFFDIEVNISDTNLGSIDNTEIDKLDPPGAGTARILASPRDEFFDYWGPGIQQEEGIGFMAVCSRSKFYDGYLASFVFTCDGPGDVNLNLKNWESLSYEGQFIFPTLAGITIHQTGSCGQTMMLSGSIELSSASMSSQVLTEKDIAELIEFTEQLWQEEEVRKEMSREELDEFVDMIKKSYVEQKTDTGIID